MQKILYVVNVDWFFISHRLPIAKKAMEEGYEVHLACAVTDNADTLSQLGIHLHELKFSRSGNKVIDELKTIAQLRNLIREVEPDLVHAITIKPVLYSGLVIRSINNKPAFVAAISGLGYVFSAKTLRAKITKLLVSFIYRLALSPKLKLVIFQNQSDEITLTRVAKLNNSEKTLIKGSGADLTKFAKYEEPESDIKIVMACRLLKEKGVYEYVEAAKIVKAQKPNVEFLLVGAPDHENPNSVAVSEIKSWEDEGIITALGKRDDVDKIFKNSHIVALPSYYGEGLPKVLIEAAACGRPIVTTDNAGCIAAVIEDVTGLIVPVKNSMALANAFLKLIEDKDLRQKMGSRARDYAEQEFDVTSVVERHISIYDNLMSDSHAR